MLDFDEQKILGDHRNGINLIHQTEAIVDQICQRGYSTIFYLGIGGTALYAGQMMHIIKQLGGTVPFYLENAADFCLVGNPFMDQNSVVVIESVSGDTVEIVEALDKARAIGAKVIGYVENEDSILSKMCDYRINTTNAAYYFWYTVTLRFLKNAGQFNAYDKFFTEIVKLPEAIVQVYKDADADAKAYAEKYCDEPITYLIGSGNLEDWATCYGMCIMEEMQWMRTRPVSAANFFHGTLEVIERDTPVILIKGEDKTRPEMERVERFVHRISAKVIVFDTANYQLDGISDEFRWILAPIVMRSAFQRVNVHLQFCRRHPLEIRRYYRRLNY
ncbi:MAG: SIS domain-containing protein [Candidatus Limiplasma sp.]|nr:SIS domain-containing protein [Candidatus Limiplasma sp.]